MELQSCKKMMSLKENGLLRILMLEDLEEDAVLVERALRKENVKFLRTRVENREDFMAALNTFNPDIILSDHSLPQFNSIEAIKICHEKEVEIPFILVTGAVSDEFAVNCMKMGAADYVLKTNLSRLPRAIQQALDQHRSEKQRLSQEDVLRKQYEELKKVNGELDAFMYRVSHDLRSPLSSILGLVNVARLEEKSADLAQSYFEMIKHNVQRLDETLREIQDYHKNARSEPLIEQIDLETIINECITQSHKLKGFDQIVTYVDVQQQTSLYSDAYRLFAILSNLISNSIKYRDDGKENRIVSISAFISESEVKLEVLDNGIGIPEEYQSRIFDMFFRATERSQGAGLGLYIVREMVTKLNGWIEVNSEHGTGTTMHIFLPNCKAKWK